MTDAAALPLSPSRGGHGSVSATRTGDRRFLGRNARGGEVRIAPEPAEGAFTPGELLKLALAACAGMSADRVISRRLGDDVVTTWWAHGTSDEETNRYTHIDEEFLVEGLDALSVEDRDRLVQLIERSIERGCTVARSIDGAIPTTTTISDVAGR